MKCFALSTIATSLALFAPLSVEAVTVSPRGVNVRTFGVTTVFLTFFGLNDQRPAEALWCGAINANQSCVPGTVFGRLPIRSNLATRSGSNNLTDIMTIPASVARRAYQDALRGNSSEFFYVRRFVSRTGGADEFVAVTCRLAGGGARVPLALTNVRLEFVGSANTKTPANRVVQVIAQGQEPPTLQADIRYNGTGRLKGRWEVVLPGDTLPSRQDLLTEATLPIEQRGLQRRYSLVESFDRFLPPTGQVILPGPDPAKLPKNTTGLHLILLRIEATADREGNSFTGVGTVNSGGVAGFPMPVLRYFVSPGASATGLIPTSRPALTLLQPALNTQLSLTQPVLFRWQGVPNVRAYKLELRETKTETVVLAAVLNQGTTRYTAPSWLQNSTGQSFSWRVTAIAEDGKAMMQSDWRELHFARSGKKGS